MFHLTLGTGLLIAALLAEKGWSRIPPMSLALPVLFIGGTVAIAQHVGDWLTHDPGSPACGVGVFVLRHRTRQVASTAWRTLSLLLVVVPEGTASPPTSGTVRPYPVAADECVAPQDLIGGTGLLR